MKKCSIFTAAINYNERFHMEGHVEFGEETAMGVFDTHVCISIIAPYGVAVSGRSFECITMCVCKLSNVPSFSQTSKTYTGFEGQ